MQEIIKYNEKIFESIKHVDEKGQEFWYARELMPLLEYKKWERFNNVIEIAKNACKNSGYDVKNQFPDVGKLIKHGKGGTRKIKDYKLSRYACYLIVQNSDPRKEAVALGQTYFAVQTRKQELSELEYEKLSEDEKRLYQRNLVKKGNHSLNQAAKNAGVKNFDNFHNAGYKGLYNGETANDIFKRKKLRYREDILDNMGEDELVANLFRINQTKQKLIKDNTKTESESNKTHYTVGKKVRKAIKDIGGTMPEDLPTPEKSLKVIAKDNKRLNNKEEK